MVYLVIDYDYVVCVFANKEKAEAYVKTADEQYRAVHGCDTGYTIEERAVW